MPSSIATITTSGQLSPVLKRLRKDLGLSQEALGQKLGLSQERISVMERHPERLPVDQLLTLLMALNAQLELTRKETPDVTARSTDWGAW